MEARDIIVYGFLIAFFIAIVAAWLFNRGSGTAGAADESTDSSG